MSRPSVDSPSVGAGALLFVGALAVTLTQYVTPADGTRKRIGTDPTLDPAM
jgi:hypothetical protein